jgi:spore germination cell wall hydrolase CwlJ-like protein
LGETLAPIQRWAAGEAPVVMLPQATAELDVKPALPPIEERTKAEMKADIKEGVTVAGKGEVTGEGRRPKTPAEMLGLLGKSRAKAEKCLANAVYFESRSEPVRGQIAVAQVVINRAFSGYYPEDICGVVYQNAHRHLSCQFTFACDGIPDIVTERDEWERAKRIARDSLDGKLWLRDVGKATHYHASYVYPYWVRSMHRLTKIGLHRFYRPRKWGDGSDEPNWSTPAAMANASDKF